MQNAGVTIVIMMIVLYALGHLFLMAPLWVKLIVLSPILFSLGRLLWAIGKRLWGVYRQAAWEFKIRRMMSRVRRM
ncbi:hypothetical protein [Thiomonas bhubaneswarensis]|uniref:Uncharacterized protein n=1 Tax=Thiomonas bhubaneswarensis TaxID=339866 RepID=A0A0K6I1J2_9BURK|nr:hypothetical protein [Thiomonas bhubaneswarensis]CUA97000.1 hypothetical protein Ga0061069_10554 [Thiomonas bhubaneswarensis]